MDDRTIYAASTAEIDPRSRPSRKNNKDHFSGGLVGQGDLKVAQGTLLSIS